MYLLIHLHSTSVLYYFLKGYQCPCSNFFCNPLVALLRILSGSPSTTWPLLLSAAHYDFQHLSLSQVKCLASVLLFPYISSPNELFHPFTLLMYDLSSHPLLTSGLQFKAAPFRCLVATPICLECISPRLHSLQSCYQHFCVSHHRCVMTPVTSLEDVCALLIHHSWCFTTIITCFISSNMVYSLSNYFVMLHSNCIY